MQVNSYVHTVRGTVVALILLSSAFTIARGSPWPMFRHDLKHSGHTPYTGPSTPTLAWTFPATDGIASSPTIADDGTIYVGAGWHFAGATDHHVYAVNPDGSMKWSYEGDNGFFSSAALDPDGTIYITSLDGHLYALEDMETHAELKWRTYLDYFFNLSSPAVGADGTIYAGSPSFDLYALHPDDGSINWNWHSDWCIISSPAIGDDDTIYVGSKDHHLYAFDDTLEAPRWQFPTGTFYDGHLVDSSPAIGADGTIYFGTDQYGAAGQTPIPVDTSFWAVNPDGTLKWSFDTGDGVESSPAIGPDGTIYFGSYDGYLYAVQDGGSTGVLQWKFPTGGAIDGSPTVDGDGIIYFGSRDATLYALYPDGTVKWTFPAGGGFESSPTIDDRGYLYIGCMDGNLYALGTGAPDVGVASVHLPGAVQVDTTHDTTVTFRNYRGEEASFNVTCVIEADETVVYSDSRLVVIPGGSGWDEQFGPWNVGPDIDVEYTVTVMTSLPGDDNTDNNEWLGQSISVDYDIVAPVPAAYPDNRQRNRYIQFDPSPANAGRNIAFRVTLTSLMLGSCDDSGSPDVEGWSCRTDNDCRACSSNGNACWSAPLHCAAPETCDLTGAQCLNDQPGSVESSWWVGPAHPTYGNDVHLLVSEPWRKVSTSWPDIVHVADCEVVPIATYAVRAHDVDTEIESDALDLSTTAKPDNWWGDCVGALGDYCTGNWAPCTGDGDCPPGETCIEQWPPPDGIINFQDITAAVFTFSMQPGLAVTDIANLDLQGSDGGDANVDPPNYVINFADIANMVLAFQGHAYPYRAPANCPNFGEWP